MGKEIEKNVLTKRVNVDVPADLHKEFKRKVFDEDTTITDVVNKWIKHYLREKGE